MTANQRKILVWLLVAILATLVTYVIFRGYLGPDFLLGFANTFSC